MFGDTNPSEIVSYKACYPIIIDTKIEEAAMIIEKADLYALINWMLKKALALSRLDPRSKKKN
jgi:hypothetical protein